MKHIRSYLILIAISILSSVQAQVENNFKYCNCIEDMTALNFGNFIDKADAIDGWTTYKKLQLVDFDLSTKKVINVIDNISIDLFLENVYLVNKTKKKLFVAIDKKSNELRYKKVFENKINFNEIRLRFKGQYLDPYGDPIQLIVFSDNDNKYLFAMKKEFWSSLNNSMNNLKIVGFEIKKYRTDKYKDLQKTQLSTDLKVVLVQDTIAERELITKFTSQNPSTIVESEDLDIKFLGKKKYKVDHLAQPKNVNAFSLNNNSFELWFLNSNKYNDNFLRDVATDIFNIDGLNYKKEISSIPNEYLDKEFWLEKIKKDSTLQSHIVSDKIQLPMLFGKFKNSYISNDKINGFSGSSNGRNGRLEFFQISSLNLNLTEYDKSFVARQDLNPDYINLRYYNNISKLSPLVSLKKETVEEKIACVIQNIICEYIARIGIIKENLEEAKKEEKQRAEFRQKLISKYGKKYTDEAQNGNIVVGMPEGLLPIPLRVWSIKSRDNFSNGYKLWCKFRLDTSKRLLVVVRDGKVTRVSTW